MLKSTVSETITRLTGWLLAEARLIDDTGGLDLAIIDRLRDAGLPLTRYTTGVPSLHPHVDSFSALWEEENGLTFRQFRNFDTPVNPLLNSPIFVAYEGRPCRCRLEEPPQEGEFEILAELRETGLTDYIVLALPFADGSFKAMSFATNRPGGFASDEIAVMEALAHPLAVAVEVRYLRHLAGTLMDTYVGPVAGRKVLDGAIRRGSGETIRAAIWYCDLKGFTELSGRLPGETLIETLNAYFDVVTRAIEAQGGEVLKFIGDAVLAIFQPGEGGDCGACRSALCAAQDAVAEFTAVNASRRDEGFVEIECGIALHFGDVLYGNVGGENRLDFTVIGPAVNLASRIESLTRDLDQPVLVSERFAALHAGSFEDLGSFALKGIETPCMVCAAR